jgi:hypothetical protein
MGWATSQFAAIRALCERLKCKRNEWSFATFTPRRQLLESSIIVNISRRCRVMVFRKRWRR